MRHAFVRYPCIRVLASASLAHTRLDNGWMDFAQPRARFNGCIKLIRAHHTYNSSVPVVIPQTGNYLNRASFTRKRALNDGRIGPINGGCHNHRQPGTFTLTQNDRITFVQEW